MTQLAKFNLKVVDESKRGRIEMHTNSIKSLMRNAANDIVQIGNALLEVKNLLAHGQFSEWLQQEFAWTERTAENFMNVAKRFKSEKISDLYVAPTALYLLAAPSTPQSAVDEFFKRAKSGERVTVEAARNLILEHKPKPASKPAARPQTDVSAPLGAPAPSASQSFYQHWQEYAQRDPKSVHFATTGKGDDLWLTFEGDAVRVARLLGLRLQKFILPGDAVAVRECVLLEVPTPKPAWWEGMYVALETNVHWYPETDPTLLTVAENQLTISQVGETTPLEAPEVPTTESIAPIATSSEGFPIPGARPAIAPNGVHVELPALDGDVIDPFDALVVQVQAIMRSMTDCIAAAESQMQTTQQRALWRWLKHSVAIVLSIVEPKLMKYQKRPVKAQAIRDDLAQVDTTDALRPIRAAVDALKLGEEAVDGIVAELHAEINEVFARLNAATHPEEAAA